MTVILPCLSDAEYGRVRACLEHHTHKPPDAGRGVCTWTTLGGDGINWPTMAAVGMMLGCGLRVGECVSVRWWQVLYHGAVVQMLELEAGQTKNRAARSIPLPDWLRALLTSAWAIRWGGDNPPWEDPRVDGRERIWGKSVRSLQRAVERFTLAVIDRRVNCHQLRHTFATRLIRVVDVHSVQTLLGHVDLSSTQVYLHPTAEMLRAAVNDADRQEVRVSQPPAGPAAVGHGQTRRVAHG